MRKIYVKGEKKFVPVEDNVYYEYYQPIWAYMKKEQRNGRCGCPQNKIYQCDGDCCNCTYRTSGNMTSFDMEIGDGKLGDTIADSFDVEKIVEDRILLEQLLIELEKLDPDGKKIFELLGEGLSDRNIAEELGRKRSTFAYQMKKIRNFLIKFSKTLDT